MKKISLSTMVFIVVALSLSLFQLYTAHFGFFTAVIQRGVHITLAIVILFLVKPLSKRWNNWLTRLLNWLFIVLILATQLYLLNYATPEQMVVRAVSGPSNWDFIVGGCIIVLILEATRRACKPLAWVALAFLLYGYFGDYFPRIITHSGHDVASIIDYMIFSTEGVYGLPLGVSATIITLFVLFGAFLEASGGGKFFVNLALSLTGKHKSGPALSAVVSSSLMGCISGSAVANVATTGIFTIPLMKKVGYRSSFAGAVEAAASTGGQLMPPIMGAGAFIMAEVLGIPYLQVALAALFPALLFYIGIGWMIHLESEKLGLLRLSTEELPNLKATFYQGFHFFIPLLVLITMLLGFGTSPTKAGLWAIISVVLVSYLKKESRLTPVKIYQALINGAKGAVDVAIACAAAGLVIGIFTLTGLGLKLSNLVITISQGNLFIALLLTMIVCIILGMGVPTAAAYIITATLVAPALMDLGVEPIAAHLFIFYFAIISAITPPVGLAAFAGAGIAKSNAMRTAFTATRLGIVAYVVPFILVYSPSLVFVGPLSATLINVFTALLGVALIGVGIQGWFVFSLNYRTRVSCIISSIALLMPWLVTDLFGMAGTAFLFYWFSKKRQLYVKEHVSNKRALNTH